MSKLKTYSIQMDFTVSEVVARSKKDALHWYNSIYPKKPATKKDIRRVPEFMPPRMRRAKNPEL